MEERYLNPHTDFKELKIYEDSMNAYRDIVNAIKTAEKKKYAEGRAEGLAEVAKKMLAKGMTAEDVAELTGISAEDIGKLIK